MSSADVVVVGAGPAGLGAAIECARRGLSVIVLDEYLRPGGRLLGQLHENPRRRGGERWWNGREVAQRLVNEAVELGVSLRCNVQVWGARRVASGLQVHCGGEVGRTQAPEVDARAVVLATGAGERPLALPGWTLPGVMTVGAAQIMANLHRVRPGERALIVGIDALSLTVAHELTLAGVEVVSLVMPPQAPVHGRAGDPQQVFRTLADLARLAPGSGQRLGGWLGRKPWLQGAALKMFPRRGVRAWGVPVRVKTTALSIDGDEQVEGATLVDVNRAGRPVGAPYTVEVDLVCVAGGLRPLTELAGALGCAVAHVPELGGPVPIHGPGLESTQPGVFVAGNMAGVEGAPVAIAHGRLAGTSVARSLGAAALAEDVAAAVQAVDTARREAPIRFLPSIEAGRQEISRRWADLMVTWAP